MHLTAPTQHPATSFCSKNKIKGRKFTTANELKTAVDAYFADFPKGMWQFEKRWIKCRRGRYVEKQFFFGSPTCFLSWLGKIRYIKICPRIMNQCT
jgi:hypothetical protein